MDMVKIAGIGILTVFLAAVLKPQSKEYALLLSAAFGLITLGLVLARSEAVVETIAGLFEQTGLDFRFFDVILKAVGISYLAYFASNIAKDAGENAIGAQIELAAKLLLLTLSLPVLLSLCELILELIAA